MMARRALELSLKCLGLFFFVEGNRASLAFEIKQMQLSVYVSVGKSE